MAFLSAYLVILSFYIHKGFFLYVFSLMLTTVCPIENNKLFKTQNSSALMNDPSLEFQLTIFFFPVSTRLDNYYIHCYSFFVFMVVFEWQPYLFSHKFASSPKFIKFKIIGSKATDQKREKVFFTFISLNWGLKPQPFIHAMPSGPFVLCNVSLN